VHGLQWRHVRTALTFAELWPTLCPLFDDVDLVVAHNAAFDRSVLRACCEWYGVAMPEIPFACTVQLARRTWGLRPTKLPDVARHLGLRLDHHDALSDAETCARIMLAATW
jgi:DNA polymerase-3 subunit epsilon